MFCCFHPGRNLRSSVRIGKTKKILEKEVVTNNEKREKRLALGDSG